MEILAKSRTRYQNLFGRCGRLVGRNPWRVVVFVGALELAFGMALFWSTNSIIEMTFIPRQSQASIDEQRLRELKYGNLNWYSNLIGTSDVGVLYLFPREHVQLEYIIKFSENQSVNDVHTILKGVASNCIRSFGKQFIPENADLTNPVDSFYYGNLFADTFSDNGHEIRAVFYKILVNYHQYFLNDGTRFSTADYNLNSFEQCSMKPKTFAYYTPTRRDRVMNSDFENSIYVFVLTLLAVWTLTTVSSWSRNNNNVGQSVVLLVVPLLSTILSTVAGFSVVSLFGVSITFGILGYIPLITLIQSLIHMQVQFAVFSNIDHEEATEEKTAIYLKKSCAWWSMTSLAQLIVFSIGVASSIPAIQRFFFFASSTFLFSMLNEVILVPACMAIHDRRIKALWHFCCCQPISELNKPAKRSKITQKFHSWFCEGHGPKTRNDTFGFFDYIIELFLSKVVSQGTKFKMIIFSIYIIGVVCTGYSTSLLDQNDRDANMVSSKSVLRKFFEWDAKFTHSIPVNFIVDEPLNYSNPIISNKINNLLVEVGQDPNIQADLSINWLKNATWRNNQYDYILCSPSCSFNSQIYSSRFIVFAKNLKWGRSKVSLMSRMRSIADNADFNVFAYSPDFHLYEQYEALMFTFLEMAGIPIACLIPFLLIFLNHRIVSIVSFVSLTTISTVYNIGLLSLFNVSFNFLSIFPIVFVIVLSNASILRVVATFLDSDLSDDKLYSVVLDILVPTVKSSICCMIGLLCMVGFTSYISYTLFCTFMTGFAVIVIHHGVLLPVWCCTILNMKATVCGVLLGTNRVGVLPDKDETLNKYQF